MVARELGVELMGVLGKGTFLLMFCIFLAIFLGFPVWGSLYSPFIRGSGFGASAVQVLADGQHVG